MGKSSNLRVAPAKGSGKRNPTCCLGCHCPIFYGDRCPRCAHDVKVKAAKRRRKRR